MTSSAMRSVAFAADVGHRRPVPVGRRDDPTGADHGLADERGDATGQLVENASQVVRIVVRHLRDVTDERAVAVAHCRDARATSRTHSCRGTRSDVGTTVRSG